MNVQSVHHSIQRTLSDGDAILIVLHINDGMVCCHCLLNSVNTVYDILVMPF